MMMEHAITIGDVVWWDAGVLGVCIVIAIPLWLFYGRGMSR